MKKVCIVILIVMLVAGTPCMSASWELIVSDDKTTPQQDRWSIDIDSIFWMRPGYVQAWVKGENELAIVLYGDKKSTKVLLHYVGFTKTKQMCIMKTDQRFTDGSRQITAYECNFVDIEPNSAGMFFWRFLFNAR